MFEYKLPANVENLTAYRSPAPSLWTTPDETVRVMGNALNNIIIGTNENDYVAGGDGDDILMTRQAQNAGQARADDGIDEDVLDGGNGNDWLVEIGKDTASLYGGQGNDTYVLSDQGYGGTDAAQFRGWNTGETANGGHDTVHSASASTLLATNVEDLVYTGKAGSTHLWGNDSANFITGGKDSADDIRGYAGNDVLDGGVGAGADTLDGGSGADLLRGWGGNDRLYGGADNDVLFGGDGDDKLYGDTGDDELQGDAGNDQLLGEAGNDSLYGGDGNDNMSGGDGNDKLYGGAGADRLDGGNQNDMLDGGDGDDMLFGDAGNDTLVGGAGNDLIVGGVGIDKLTGGSGKDIFQFNTVTDSTWLSGGIDTIVDFVHGIDKIDLHNIDASYAAGDQAFIFRGTQGYQAGAASGQVVVAYENGNTFVRADYTGDGKTDIEIMLVGTVPLDSTDFFL